MVATTMKFHGCFVNGFLAIAQRKFSNGQRGIGKHIRRHFSATSHPILASRPYCLVICASCCVSCLAHSFFSCCSHLSLFYHSLIFLTSLCVLPTACSHPTRTPNSTMSPPPLHSSTPLTLPPCHLGLPLIPPSYPRTHPLRALPLRQTCSPSPLHPLLSLPLPTIHAIAQTPPQGCCPLVCVASLL